MMGFKRISTNSRAASLTQKTFLALLNGILQRYPYWLVPSLVLAEPDIKVPYELEPDQIKAVTMADSAKQQMINNAKIGLHDKVLTSSQTRVKEVTREVFEQKQNQMTNISVPKTNKNSPLFPAQKRFSLTTHVRRASQHINSKLHTSRIPYSFTGPHHYSESIPGNSKPGLKEPISSPKISIKILKDKFVKLKPRNKTYSHLSSSMPEDQEAYETGYVPPQSDLDSINDVVEMTPYPGRMSTKTPEAESQMPKSATTFPFGLFKSRQECNLGDDQPSVEARRSRVSRAFDAFPRSSTTPSLATDHVASIPEYTNQRQKYGSVYFSQCWLAYRMLKYLVWRALVHEQVIGKDMHGERNHDCWELVGDCPVKCIAKLFLIIGDH